MHTNPHVHTEEELIRRIRSTMDPGEIVSLANRPRWRGLVYRHLNPEAVDLLTLQLFASRGSFGDRLALLQNDRLPSDAFPVLLEHSINIHDMPGAIKEWLQRVWDTFPERRVAVRDVFRTIARGESRNLPGSIARDVALALLEIDSELSVADLKNIASFLRHDMSVLVAVAQHPNAEHSICKYLVDTKILRNSNAHFFEHTDLIRALLKTPIRTYRKLRDHIIDREMAELMLDLASDTSAEEALRMIQRLRGEGSATHSIEIELVKRIPDSALTQELQLLLLRHPDREVRLSHMRRLSDLPHVIPPEVSDTKFSLSPKSRG